MDQLNNLQEQLGLIMLTVVGLIALAALCMWVARWIFRQRWAIRNPSPSLQVLERLPISPKTTLFLVDADGRSLLLAESSEEICAVADLSRFRLNPPTPEEKNPVHATPT